MSGVNNELNRQLWSASSLAMSISLEGNFPSTYKSDSRYINAKFKGDLYTFVDRENKYNAGYIRVNDTGIIISFRGTKSENINDLKDWLNDIKINHVDFYPYGKVHEGFYKAIKYIYRHVK